MEANTEHAPYLKRHEEAKTERERAVIECEFTAKFAVVGGRNRNLVAKVFSVTQCAAASRISLLRAEPASLPLWERINTEGMPLTTAASQLEAAKRLMGVFTDLTLVEAVVQQLKEYDTYPWSTSKSGQRYRKPTRNSTRLMPKKKKRANKATQRDFFDRARLLVSEGVRSMLVNTHEIEVTRFLSECDAELKDLFDSYRSRMARYKKASKVDSKAKALMSFSSVRSACETLNINPPNPGLEVNLDEARKQKRRFVKAYHPDGQGGGTEATNAQYRQVVTAFEVIEDYNRCLSM